MKHLFFILIFISNIIFAQNITFIYELKYKPDPKKEIKTEYYYLDVLGSQSVFRSESAREADSLMQKNGFWQSRKPTFDHIYSFKNLISNKVYKSVTHPAMYDLYYVNIDDKLEWQILPEKKKIGDMECQKASVQYGNRNWIAWFDAKNPLHEGPYIFHGLPGFIVNISDEKGEYNFSLIRTKRSDKNNMFYVRKGKEISWDAYKKLQSDYYNDPFAEVKARGIKTKVGDTNGNTLDVSFKQMAESIQKQMKENNNPVELDKRVEFKN
ncbi:Protein of unknown function (Porph_ging) [Chryseobacterium oranimense G311]|uniref:GLPGLI family protein n=1 Tax=Chryseobacterium oranimense TaxID=421058 RepID=UPI000533BB6A|nr:GLPGLI family protein [Chryseobacterium oranimense]CEJ69052.1 Protein of unknown function (Porph_ging) [Chryseobacterium oranimense G311]